MRAIVLRCCNGPILEVIAGGNASHVVPLLNDSDRSRFNFLHFAPITSPLRVKRLQRSPKSHKCYGIQIHFYM